MKRFLIAFVLMAIAVVAHCQNWYLIENDSITRTGMPTRFKSVVGYVPGQYRQLSDSVHYTDGWRTDIVPAFDSTYCQLGARYYNTEIDKVTWHVDSIDVEQLRAEYLQEITTEYNAQILQLSAFATFDIGDSITALITQLTAIKAQIKNMDIKQLQEEIK